MKNFFIIFVAFFIAACGAKTIEGTYYAQMGGHSFTFNSNGTAFESGADGAKIGKDFTYKIEGSSLSNESKTISFVLKPDGSMASTAYGALVKK